MSEPRLARECVPLVRDHGIVSSVAHPFFRGAVDPSIAPIWFNTVRLTSPAGTIGSGCLVQQRGANRAVIVTNAHVVESSGTLTYEWLVGPFIHSGVGSLLAIDYLHDLAVLVLDDGSIPHPDRLALEIGDPPSPGEQVSLCGFPRGCDLPRLARGVVSGYGVMSMSGVDVTNVIVQAPINQGNSGGPICNDSGQLVGVTWAINPRVDPTSPRPRSRAANEAIDWLTDSLVPVDGYGYALDPRDVTKMIDAITAAENYGRHKLDNLPPDTPFPRAAFVELQRLAVLSTDKPAGTSCIGIFNFSPDRKILLGWHQGEQCEIGAPREWISLLTGIMPQGGHFYLRGHQVVHYYRNPKYRRGIWVCRAVLNLT